MSIDCPICFKNDSIVKIRQIHLYYFKPCSLEKLLESEGYKYSMHTSQKASITNHFHWMHHRECQAKGNLITSVSPPVKFAENLNLQNILDETDNFYLKSLEENNMGDLLSARVWVSKSS